ncbi:SCP domain-containing protein [Trichostrongylus colubriformis]|uniref:SCP domain-containing protein n=1 Tax=Trichostrongylus colubriformis TaxID=6319 RepID=A0AAN8FES0_TRICO
MESTTGASSTVADELPTTTSTTTTTTATSMPSTSETMAPTTSTTKSSTTTTPSMPATTTTMPGSHGNITEEIRLKIVNMHNYRRSRLAQGFVKNGRTGEMLPAGSNIFNMSYSMELEQAAQEYANTCPSTGSTSLNDMGENFASISSNTKTFHDCLYEAIKSFWSQIKTQSITSKVMFTEKLAKRPNAPLKFTQMAWAETYLVGCGVQRCGPNTVVVCRYSPRGNIVNQSIYKRGRMCTACPHDGCTTDRMHQGLCVHQ